VDREALGRPRDQIWNPTKVRGKSPKKEKAGSLNRETPHDEHVVFEKKPIPEAEGQEPGISSPQKKGRLISKEGCKSGAQCALNAGQYPGGRRIMRGKTGRWSFPYRTGCMEIGIVEAKERITATGLQSNFRRLNLKGEIPTSAES